MSLRSVSAYVLVHILVICIVWTNAPTRSLPVHVENFFKAVSRGLEAWEYSFVFSMGKVTTLIGSVFGQPFVSTEYLFSYFYAALH